MSLSTSIVLVSVAAVGLTFVRTRVIAYRLSRLCWDDLLQKLEPVPITAIETIAVDYLNPGRDQFDIDTSVLWKMIGEEDGVRKIYANAKVLIALAGYAQRWDRRGSLIVMERILRDAVTLRRAALRLSIGVVMGYDRVQGPFNVQEVASAYYLMRGRVLALYETNHVARLAHLASLL